MLYIVLLLIIWLWAITTICKKLKFIEGLTIKIFEAISKRIERKADKDTMEMVKKYFNK